MSDDAREGTVSAPAGLPITAALRKEIRGISTDRSLTETQKADRRRAAFDRARSGK